MPDQNNTEEKIAQYLDGLLSEEEERAFEKKMEEDTELSESVQYQKEGYKAIKTLGALHIMDQLEKKERRIQWQKRGLWLLVIAALLTAFYFFANPFVAKENSQLIFAQYFEPYRAPTAIRGEPGQQSYPENFHQGAEAYRSQNYETAAQYFSQTSTDPLFEEISNFYSGVSYLAHGDNENAIKYLTLAAKGEGDYELPSVWYLSLAHIRSDRATDAKETLTQLLNDPSGYRAEESRELLERLK